MSKTIGIVVRQERLRQLLAEKMAAVGVRVLATASAVDALNWTRDKAVNALILDLHLEETHGDDLCKEIKSTPETAKLPVLMLIEENDDWFRVRCDNAKADVVLAYAQGREIVDKAKQLLFAEIRVATPGAIEYYFVEGSNREVFKGNVLDVSVEGIAFRAAACEIERDMTVDVRLRLPELQAVMGRATCVRVRPPGSDGNYLVGLRWDAYRKGDRERLAEWIETRA